MKRLIALALSLTLVLGLFACSPQVSEPQTKTTAAESQKAETTVETTAAAAESSEAAKPSETEAPQAAVQESVYPLTVKDQVGRTVTIEAQPQRMVSGYYISSSTCIALGLKSRLVAVEEKTEARPIYKLAAPELIGGDIGNVGSAKAFDLEACLAAKPDLVILPKKAKDYAKTLEDMGIACLVVKPEGHQELVDMVRLIGQVSNCNERAEKLVSAYDRILDQVKSVSSQLAADAIPSVYICGNKSYLSTAPKDMYQASLIAAVGGKNAGDSLDGDAWTDVSYEQLLAMNPDVIIIPTNNMANGQPDFYAEDILKDENLAELKAVKNKQIYNMPAGYEAWDSPVPSGVLGMLWLLSTLHPEQYSHEQFVKEAGDFYQTFYGFALDPQTLQ